MNKFIFLLLLFLNTSVGANECRNIFGDPEVQKAIQALAKLRFALDRSLADGKSDLLFKAVSQEYEKKKMALLKHLTTGNYMSREAFFTLIKEEVEELQKDFREFERDKTKQVTALEQIFDGSRVHFNSHRPRDGSTPYGLMTTPTTQIIWRKVGELINSRLDENYHIADLDPSNEKNPLFPVSNVSFDNISKWIEGLNKLSQMGEPSLRSLIIDHLDGDVYKLPMDAQWENFLREMTSRPFTLQEYEDRKSILNEEVTAKLPYSVQGQEYFKLGEDNKHIVDKVHRFDKSHTSVIFIWSLNNVYHMALHVGENSYPKNKNKPDLGDAGITFRLTRQRP